MVKVMPLYKATTEVLTTCYLMLMSQLVNAAADTQLPVNEQHNQRIINAGKCATLRGGYN